MKCMNSAHDENRQGFVGQVFCKIGNKFAELAVNPRGCWGEFHMRQSCRLIL